MRTDEDAETAFKRWTAKAFYRLMNRLSKIKIPLDVGDFRLMDRKVVEALLAMPERDRFLRGMVSWVGFKQVAVPYRRPPRFAGTSKHPLLKMIQFAADGVLSFSFTPLRLAIWTGFISIGLAIAGIIYAVVLRLYTTDWVPGWGVAVCGNTVDERGAVNLVGDSSASTSAGFTVRSSSDLFISCKSDLASRRTCGTRKQGGLRLLTVIQCESNIA